MKSNERRCYGSRHDACGAPACESDLSRDERSRPTPADTLTRRDGSPSHNGMPPPLERAPYPARSRRATPLTTAMTAVSAAIDRNCVRVSGEATSRPKISARIASASTVSTG
ncbi:hypothetical protein NB722_000456 [Xanthomonas sacchari]|nr:hypothetical protein [Xanthomonas sacchari]